MNDPKRILVVATVFTLVVLGVLGLKGVAEDAGYKNQVKYTTAVRVEDEQHFNYAVDTQQGNLLAHGLFTTKKEHLVKFEEMTKAYTYVERVKEHYTLHTQTYSCGSSKHPRTCTRTYYSWDRVGYEEKYAPYVQLYGREYPANKFNFDNFKQDADCAGFSEPEAVKGWFSPKRGCQNKAYYIDSDDRYVYKLAPESLSATFLASSMGGGLNPSSEGSITLKNGSVDDELKAVGNYKVWAFWIATVFIVFAAIISVYAAIRWVFDDGEWSLHD